MLRGPKSLIQVAALYENNIAEKGVNPKALGWKEQSDQWLRFKKLTNVLLEAEDSVFTVNDYGCGYGSMFHFFDEIKPGLLGKYYGYDISENMLHEAKKINKDKRTEFFHTAEIMQIADYSFVSGSFNVKFNATDEEWLSYIKERLLKLAEMSKKGFSFNLLSSYVDWKEPHLYYANPLELFDFCKKNISKKVVLIHDYDLYEFTIGVLS